MLGEPVELIVGEDDIRYPILAELIGEFDLFTPIVRGPGELFKEFLTNEPLKSTIKIKVLQTLPLTLQFYVTTTIIDVNLWHHEHFTNTITTISFLHPGRVVFPRKFVAGLEDNSKARASVVSGGG